MPLLSPQRGFTIEDQLRNLSIEELNALEQEIRKKQTGEIATGVSGSLLRGAENMLSVSQGRPISESGDKPDKYEELLRTEQLKNQIDPSRRASQLELDEIERKRQEQAGATPGAGTQGPIAQQAAQQAGQEEVPPMFIEKPKGKNRYGIMEYETIENPEYKQYQDIKKEKRSAEQQIELAAEKEKRVNVSKVSRLSNIIDLIEKKYEETKTPGGISGVLRRPAEVFSRNLQLTENQKKDKAYADFVGGIRAQLARSMGDVGNLSEFEQKAVLDLIPNLWDDPETAKLKVQQLRDFIASIQSTITNKSSDETQEQADPLGIR